MSFYDPYYWREEAAEQWTPSSEGPTEKDLAEVSPKAFAKNAGWEYPDNFEDRRAKVEELCNHPEEPRAIEDMEALFCGKLDECLLYLSSERVEEDQGEEMARWEFARIVYPYVRYLAEDAKQSLASKWSAWRIKIKICRGRAKKGRFPTEQELNAARERGEEALKWAMSLLQDVFRELHPAFHPIRTACRRADTEIRCRLLKPCWDNPEKNRLLKDRKYRQCAAETERLVKPIVEGLDALRKDDQPEETEAAETGRLLAQLLAIAQNRAETVTECCARLEKKRQDLNLGHERKHATTAVINLQKTLDDFVSSEGIRLDWSAPRFRLPQLGLVDFSGTADVHDHSDAASEQEGGVTINMANFVQGDVYVENRIETQSEPAWTREDVQKHRDQLAENTKILKQLLNLTAEQAKIAQDQAKRSESIETSVKTIAVNTAKRPGESATKRNHVNDPELLDCILEYEPGKRIQFLPQCKNTLLEFTAPKEWKVAEWIIHLPENTFARPPETIKGNPKVPFESDKTNDDALRFAKLIKAEGRGRGGSKKFRLDPSRIPDVLLNR